jgi:inhibitor of KinA
MTPGLQIYPLGENSIILFVSYYDTSRCVKTIADLQQQLTGLKIPEIQSIRPGMDCLLLELADDADRDRLKQSLEKIEVGEIKETPAEIVRVPVCYEPEFATDLETISKMVGLSQEEIINIHSSQIYSVWMIGFMPGFPYLGELPKTLHIPRKSSPDPKLAAGSVAIAEEYVGVYPFDSPGGWHVLGRTPLRLFDYQRTKPSFFNYGMKVQFYPITKDEFELLHAARASVPAEQR